MNAKSSDEAFLASIVPAESVTPLTYRIEGAIKRMNITRSALYELMRTGRLKAFKIGRATIITEDAIVACLRQIERERAWKPRSQRKSPGASV